MFISSERVWLDEKFRPAVLEISEGKIVRILPYFKAEKDYGKNRIIPGLIDIHSHGYKGGATDGDREVYRRWTKEIVREGTTTFLVGVQPKGDERIKASLEGVRDVSREDIKGACLYGTFLQCFLSEGSKGAYDLENIPASTMDKLLEYLEIADGTVKTISIAPEIDENGKMLKYCVANGIRVCLGFTDCTYEQAIEAIDNGASNVVHCFNCMASVHHRNPHLPVAAMNDDRVFTEVMCDGKHVHPGILHLVGTMKGKDRLISVTDANGLKGNPPGLYDCDGWPCVIDETGFCYHPETRQIMGNVSPFIKNIENMQKIGNLDEATAINATTCNPARMLGIDNSKGYIRVNYQADLCIYDDNYDVIQTYVKGEEML